jgi:uncharacterized protein (UPF0333 family)
MTRVTIFKILIDNVEITQYGNETRVYLPNYVNIKFHLSNEKLEVEGDIRIHHSIYENVKNNLEKYVVDHLRELLQE